MRIKLKHVGKKGKFTSLDCMPATHLSSHHVTLSAKTCQYCAVCCRFNCRDFQL